MDLREFRLETSVTQVPSSSSTIQIKAGENTTMDVNISYMSLLQPDALSNTCVNSAITLDCEAAFTEKWG